MVLNCLELYSNEYSICLVCLCIATLVQIQGFKIQDSGIGLSNSFLWPGELFLATEDLTQNYISIGTPSGSFKRPGISVVDLSIVFSVCLFGWMNYTQLASRPLRWCLSHLIFDRPCVSVVVLQTASSLTGRFIKSVSHHLKKNIFKTLSLPSRKS